MPLNQNKKPAQRNATRVLSCLMILVSFFSFFCLDGSFEVSGETLPIYSEEDIYRIGITFDASVESASAFTSSAGVRVGVSDSGSDEFRSLMTFSQTSYTVAADTSYYVTVFGYTRKNGTTVSVASDPSGTKKLIASLGYSAVYAYDGEFCLRVGGYASQAEAKTAQGKLNAALASGGDSVSFQSEVSSLVYDTVLLKSSSGEKLFSFVASGGMYLGVEPIATSSGVAQLGKNGNTYYGIFEFHRQNTTLGDGIALTNLVPLHQYVPCVMSREIYASWTVEVQKVFAVAVRTYAISRQNFHNTKYGFDLCCKTCCQAYEGNGRLQANATAGANATRGQVLTYNGKIANVNYTAISGGVTVRSSDAWGGTHYPYLEASPTPWEQYGQHSPYTSKGKWTKEYTGDELYERLKTNFPNLKGTITSVHIDSYATNSSYVSQVTVTDVYGNKAVIDHTDHVRTNLGLDSACFVVGKAGETVDRIVYELEGFSSGLDAEDFTSGKLPDVLTAKTVKKTVSVTLQGTDGSFVFDGMGWGHGVGLSQYGSWDMVKCGYDYKTVLRYYYKQATLSDMSVLGSHTYKNAWSKNSSYHWHQCSDCGDIKDRELHVYDNSCDETCNTCGYVRQASHIYASDWSSNSTSHFHKCLSCGDQKDVTAHKYDNACDTTCAGCGYTRTITHSYETNWSKDTQSHWKACKVCGTKKEMGTHNFDGSCDETCNTCGYERTVHHPYATTLSGDSTHHFYACTACGNRKDVKPHQYDHACDTSCNDCGTERTIEHSYKTTWLQDENNHWQECSVCGSFSSAEGHSYDHDCDGTCNVCGVVRTTEHRYGDALESDEQLHWKACLSCGEKADIGSHRYDHDCDDTCNECEFVRAVEHRYSASYEKDMSGHWYECISCKDRKEQTSHVAGEPATEKAAQVCTVCAYVLAPPLNHIHVWSDALVADKNSHFYECEVCHSRKDEAAHTPGAEATETNNQVCTECQYVLIPALGHIHLYGDLWEKDEQQHWHSCDCGDRIEVSAHSWNQGIVLSEPTDNEAGEICYTCSVCNAKRNEEIPSLRGEEDEKDAPSQDSGTESDIPVDALPVPGKGEETPWKPPFALVLVIAVFAIGGILFFVIWRMRKNRREEDSH